MKLYFTSQLVCAKPVRLILLSTNKEDVESRCWRGAMCMHACVWRVYVLALCDSRLHPTSSNKVKRAFISAPDSPPGGDGNQSFTHSHECSESRSTTCCTNTLRMHWLTAVIKPVCGEQTESFYVGLNKTKILLLISARARVYVLVHVQRAYSCSEASRLFLLSVKQRNAAHMISTSIVHTRNYEKLSRTFHFCVYACRPLY